MKKLFNQKRGFVADIILYLVFIFILGLILVVIWYAVKSYNTAWQSTPNIPTESKSIMSDFSNRFTNVWDFFYLFLVVGFGLVVIILGFAVRSHPVFAILTMLFIVILGIVGVYFAK